MVLIVGDTDVGLAEFAKSLFSDATFILSCNDDSEHVYGSLGDVSMEQFIDFMIQADRIIYHNKSSEWSHNELEIATQQLLYDFNCYVDNRKIENIDFDQINLGNASRPIKSKKISIRNQLYNWDFDNFLGLRDRRKTHNQQLWVCGCSFADGVALKNKDDRYGQLVANHYDIPVSFLTRGSTSIDWAADQIIRADIKKDDVVVWGITGINRASWFDKNGKYFNLSFSFLAGVQGYENRRADIEEKLMLYEIITNDSRLFLSLRCIAQVQSHLAKIGAHLVMITHPELSKIDQATILVEFLKESDQYIDIPTDSDAWTMPKKYDETIIHKFFHLMHRKFKSGSDNKPYYKDLGEDYMHPGPMMHLEWANKIIDFIREKQWIREKS